MSQTHGKPDPTSPPATPRWVKVFGIIALVVVLLFVVLLLIRGGPPGGHGPGLHGGGGYSQPSDVIERALPPGGYTL